MSTHTRTCLGNIANKSISNNYAVSSASQISLINIYNGSEDRQGLLLENVTGCGRFQTREFHIQPPQTDHSMRVDVTGFHNDGLQ